MLKHLRTALHLLLASITLFFQLRTATEVKSIIVNLLTSVINPLVPKGSPFDE